MFVVTNVYSQVTVEVMENIGFVREGTRQEPHSAQSTQDRRKLLKRTRSLAVISEDESRQDREARHFKLGQSTFDLPRGHQLIPRAKLIDRNTLKDRLSKSQQHLSESYDKFNDTRSFHSRSTCGLHSIPPALESLPDSLPYPRNNRIDPDRLNILDWPEPPRRYRSVQALDTVSGLVDIVEDNWPIEGNRSIDCIYTQVKRKRKEHRSLDSILFEDDGELEYFDVLNLLPLSNVRLEFDESDARNNNLIQNTSKSVGAVNLRALEYHSSRITDEHTLRSSVSQNERYRENIESNSYETKGEVENKVSGESNHSQSRSKDTSAQYSEDSSNQESRENVESRVTLETYALNELANLPHLSGGINQRDYKPNAAEVICCGEEVDRKIEEAEDYKAIWISDNHQQEDMSRRPQVLKVVDNDVTKRWHRHSSFEGDATKQEVLRDTKFSQNTMASSNDPLDISKMKLSRNIDDADGARAQAIKEVVREENKDKRSAENTRNSFENGENEIYRNKQNEGRFERIVKETSNILGKACSAVKGSLGFEARSESSDLGLGSDSGSDSRRRSLDDGIGEEHPPNCEENTTATKLNEEKNKPRTNLTRSHSCLDSIECQDDGAEFDHVRYKIIKSNVFSKGMFSSGKGDVTYEGLMQYLREYSFQELLLDNNVVIIEPVRAETIERKSTPTGKSRSENTCKVAGAIQKKSESENQEKNNDKSDRNNTKSPKQSTIRKHFFYHPIRVNRELIDEELPDPDTVRNVRRMFENTLKPKSNKSSEFSADCKARKSVSMRDLTMIEVGRLDEMSEKSREESRSRCSSRAKDLTRLFENLEKSTSLNTSIVGSKDVLDNPRCETKTRILAQSFEARSGLTSPSDSTLSKNKVNRYNHHNWDSGSVSSGVSSDYPDTDPGSGVHCTSSEDEEADCHNNEAHDSRGPSHYVSQDVLRKIRECGTSVTYYGGKVVNMCNGPLISPLMDNRFKHIDRSNDYVKFRLVKSNSCDSRLELTGRLIESQTRCPNRDYVNDISRYTIVETPSIELTTVEKQEAEEEVVERKNSHTEMKREPPMVIGLEPKRDDSKEGRSCFKADFKVGNFEEAKSAYPGRFIPSALTRWQVNESNWKAQDDFGKMEFEEFEVLEDSLNSTENGQRSET